MKSPFIENQAAVINSLAGILDVYVFHRHGHAEQLIIRAWPKKPRDRSGNFDKTHEASKKTLDNFRSLCLEYRQVSKWFFDYVTETQLDYFRSGNQSASYNFSKPAYIQCITNSGYDPQKQLYRVLIFAPNTHYLHRATLSLHDGRPRTFETYKKKRSGLFRCQKLFRNCTEGITPCKEISQYLFEDFAPSNCQLNYFVPQYVSHATLPALSLPYIIKV